MREMEESALHHFEEVSEGAGPAEIHPEMIRIILNWFIMWRFEIMAFCHTCFSKSAFQPEGLPDMREMEESALHHLEEVSEGAGLAEIHSEMIRKILNWSIMWRFEIMASNL